MNTNLKNRVAATEKHADSLEGSQLGEWEYSDAGVEAMEDKIRLFGLDAVNTDFAPKDWAWQLVGMLGCGYSGVTKAGVKEALQDAGWTTTSWGALSPFGGNCLGIQFHKGPSENTD